MTKIEASELAKILQAYADGKTLQYIEDERGYTDIEPDTLDDECLSIYQLRIKPESKRMPLTNEDLIERRKSGFEAMWVKSKNSEKYNSEYFIDQISDEGCIIHNVYFSYESMSKYFVWLDGTPCSKEVECE